ncbi:MAG: DUF3102 domain-containing protein [gamma proteobacterium symbiont of Taylorina sp.]|nr:DUF3102 domain-containing protein [gamma proteobacterium symbiont of Taylorina sp.]
MNELITYKNNAVMYAQQIELHKTNMVTLAAKCGQALEEVKQGINHGEFGKWIEANMPVNQRQCNRYMQLFQSKPELVSNSYPGTTLDINSELLMLTTDGDVEEKVREVAEEENLSRQKIKELTNQLQEAKADKENIDETSKAWRQQYLDERNAGRELAEKLEEVKQSKVTYIKDNDQAVNQELEELKVQLKSLEGDKKKLIEDRKEAKRNFTETVNTNVKHKLESHQQEVDRLTKQETSLRSRIDILKNNDAKLEDELLGKKQRLESIREALDAVTTLAANSYEYLIEPELLEDNNLLFHWQDVINKLKPLTENIELALVRHKNSELKVIK